MKNQDWTNQEKERYAVNKSKDPALRILYAMNNLQADNPQARRDFLYNNLKLSETNQMPKIGKVEELIQLENLFSEFY